MKVLNPVVPAWYLQYIGVWWCDCTPWTVSWRQEHALKVALADCCQRNEFREQIATAGRSCVADCGLKGSCVVLCCAVLCCGVLCCDVLCSVVLCCGVLCCVVLCCGVLCSAVLCCAVLCYVVLCCVVLSSHWATGTCCVPAHCELLEHVLCCYFCIRSDHFVDVKFNGELQCILYEAAIACWKRYSGIFLEALIYTTEDRSQDGLCPEGMWTYAHSEPVLLLDIFWMQVLTETVPVKTSTNTGPPQRPWSIVSFARSPLQIPL